MPNGAEVSWSPSSNWRSHWAPPSVVSSTAHAATEAPSVSAPSACVCLRSWRTSHRVQVASLPDNEAVPEVAYMKNIRLHVRAARANLHAAWELFCGGTVVQFRRAHKEGSGEDMPKSDLEVSRRRLLAAGTATAMIGVAPHAQAQSQPANQKSPQRGVSFEV